MKNNIDKTSIVIVRTNPLDRDIYHFKEEILKLFYEVCPINANNFAWQLRIHETCFLDSYALVYTVSEIDRFLENESNICWNEDLAKYELKSIRPLLPSELLSSTALTVIPDNLGV